MPQNPSALSPYLYNEHKLEPFREKLKSLDVNKNSIYNVLVIGDSIAEGWTDNMQSTDILINTGMVGQMNNLFAKQFSCVGDGFIPANFPGNDTTWCPWRQVTGWAATGMPTRWNNYNAFSDMWKVSSSNGGDSLTFRFRGTGVQIVHVYDINGAGGYNASIDGGASTNVGLHGAWGRGVALSSVLSASGYGLHKLNVVGANGGGQYSPILGAIVLSDGTYGVRCHRLAVGGMTADQAQNALSVIDAIKPDVVIIEFLSNDYSQQRTLSLYQTSIEQIISRAEYNGAIPVLTSIGIRNSAGTIPQSSYVNVLKSIATNRDIAYYDNWSKWGGTSPSIGGNNGWYNGVHPGSAGHLEIAQDLVEALYGERILYDLQNFPSSGVPSNNLYVSAGTVFRNQSPTGGGTAGWIATTAGYANNNAWASNTQYNKGQMVNNGSIVLACTQDGNSGQTSPSGSGTSTAPAWAASTAYTANTSQVTPTTANGWIYTCTTAGTSGATQPTWPTTENATVTDGGVTWTAHQAAKWTKLDNLAVFKALANIAT